MICYATQVMEGSGLDIINVNDHATIYRSELDVWLEKKRGLNDQELVHSRDWSPLNFQSQIGC